MFFPPLLLLPSFATYVLGVTVYMAGDSTMAEGGGGSGTDGWGQYLGQYLSVAVVNKAIAGRSARSYTDEGRFDTFIDTVSSGDYIVIEFGHNDGLSGAVDNGREDAYGDGYNTTATVTTSDGESLVIHTFPYYIQNAVSSLQARGAIPIVSSQTPDNDWDNGVITDPPRFVAYAETAATRTGATYINHYTYVAQAYEALGETVVDEYYPLDHTHTSVEGANVVAEAFVRGLLCGNSDLAHYVNSAGQAVPSDCL
ncbi:rhamnogalacturonan acetylesterase [Guyanagaster necrorhizus]|uniref:Rhamnogalacturonan acetylesterase n=1 Tax=Guyanagaster necrorhizus TaxID=856835 RepID=A0A9P7W538_9AGAR|nr:rhamnogalacturonan acetylesterase [Guyanagaster necrorhizus MCA 3950]KAG7452303.1 rhamnogalacturonan acetylesterase [Guyanagaster necrorhizus MCA 3950]